MWDNLVPQVPQTPTTHHHGKRRKVTPTTKAQLTYKTMTTLEDLADALTRIPRFGYHLAGPVHRLAVALTPIYRRSLRAAADDAAHKLETCPAPRWADDKENP